MTDILRGYHTRILCRAARHSSVSPKSSGFMHLGRSDRAGLLLILLALISFVKNRAGLSARGYFALFAFCIRVRGNASDGDLVGLARDIPALRDRQSYRRCAGSQPPSSC